MNVLNSILYTANIEFTFRSLLLSRYLLRNTSDIEINLGNKDKEFISMAKDSIASENQFLVFITENNNILKALWY